MSSLTADEIAAALGDLADRLSAAPTVEQLAPIVARLSRRERAVLALVFERLAEEPAGEQLSA
ncbi:hypothetical protein [Leifsonia soli]|uniref:FixJ family two-component response regulator n=1 Tax=Leifsonia soli TaxID=582665 RepID=A0A852T336_9MICO|nr:hypothetical protein [Leifsonia soli]NYD75909.1 FixJ family two-component response regulator [Leifsonia soli]